jgi:hypothetical protein
MGLLLLDIISSNTMNRFVNKSLLFLLLLVNPNFLIGASKTFLIENHLFKKEFSFEHNKVQILSLYDKTRNKELLQVTAEKPYFEFNINHKRISANDPLWLLENVKTRKMDNGGTELSISISGINELKYLQMTILQQYFPNSTLIREQLLLKSKKKGELKLNKEQGKLHFIYPQYSFSNNALNDTISEIRMASYGKEILSKLDTNRTYDNRVKDRNLAACHMFHAASFSHVLAVGNNISLKGPFSLTQLDEYTILSTYEHASQDGIKGLRLTQMGLNKDYLNITDANQGVKTNSGYTICDSDFFFIGIDHQKDKSITTISNKFLRGSYLDNEPIPTEKYYQTVWSATAFMKKASDSGDIIRTYLLNQITENKPARAPNFYYNTWGMQRSEEHDGKDVRSVFTEARILEEMEYASQLNVDHFILDDGWEEKFGVWEYNKTRLPNGLKPLLDKAKEKNITLGVWFSLIGIDSTSQRFKDHRKWVIKSIDGTPAIGQWDNPVFDIVSDFSKLIVEDHKKLIDQGIMFFKWDAINTFNSAEPNLWHGDSSYDRKEIIDRYNYLMPFVVTDCMKQIHQYNKDVSIEIDVTEPERCMIGLMPLQEGKLFWMNNGASGYGDYSTFRAKSMRTIINQLGGVLPPEVFTYAQYPQNVAPFYAQRYNVNTSLVAGRGFWGDLKMMTKSDRETVGKTLKKAKMVLPYITGKPLVMTGRIGASPEMYNQIDVQNAFGQVIGFSGSIRNYLHKVKINSENLLCVLNQSYRLKENMLNFDFQFSIPDDTRELFIIGNKRRGISILESTGWIDDVQLEENKLIITLGATSNLKIKVPATAKNIQVNTEKFTISANNIIDIQEANNSKIIKIGWE